MTRRPRAGADFALPEPTADIRVEPRDCMVLKLDGTGLILDARIIGGYTPLRDPAESIGKSMYDVYPPSVGEAHAAAVSKVDATGKEHTSQLTIADGGTIQPYSYTVLPADHPGLYLIIVEKKWVRQPERVISHYPGTPLWTVETE